MGPRSEERGGINHKDQGEAQEFEGYRKVTKIYIKQEKGRGEKKQPGIPAVINKILCHTLSTWRRIP